MVQRASADTGTARMPSKPKVPSSWCAPEDGEDGSWRHLPSTVILARPLRYG